MAATMLAVSRQWCKDLGKNAMLWLMVLLPAGLAWAVLHASGQGPQPFSSLWLVFAQLMTGLMLTSSHWLEEREQGTWQALRLSPLPVGWLLFTQGTLLSLLTLGGEALVFAVNRGTAPLTLPLAVYGLVGAAFATSLGVLIGVGSRSARSGSMLATVTMLVLFLGAVTAPGLNAMPALHRSLAWLPSVLSASALEGGLRAVWAPVTTDLALSLWLLAALAATGAVLRRQYRDGR